MSATPTHPPPVVPDHELVCLIGRGSYGEVWLARNIMGTWRAVKVVRRDSFESERPYDREFAGIRRSEPVSRSHDGMVDILQMGLRKEEGFFYYVMELADSAGAKPDDDPQGYRPLTLAARLKDGKQLPAEDCLRLITNLAGVLAHLHDYGLIHRDVKPSNILYFSGAPRLGDIGLVAEAGSSRSFVGTEGYVPSEGPGTERADIYGLGKTLYEALTGYDRGRYPEVPPEWAQRYDFQQCLELNEIVLRACEPQAVKRYHGAREILADAALVASGKSVKRLRGLERGLKAARIGLIVLAGVAALAGGGFLWQQREAAFAREQLARKESDFAARQARNEARLAQWHGLQERVHAARFEIGAGTVNKALADAREAAADHPSMQLRNDAAFLLGRPDMVALPGGTFQNGNQYFLLNLTQRQCLRLSYRIGTPADRRTGGKAEIVAIDGGSVLPMAEDFVATHDWELKFEEGGTIITDKANHRWPVPGAKESSERPSVKNPAMEAVFAQTLPKYTGMRSSSDGRWTAAFCKIGQSEDALHIFKGSKAGPVLVERQRGGGTEAAFLDPPHFLATSSWRSITWVEDLLHGLPALRLPAAGWPLLYSPSQRLFGFHGWEFDEARTYEWRPSPMLHSFSSGSDTPTGSRFSPDERWLCTFNESGYRWWSLDPLHLDEPARTDDVPRTSELFFHKPETPEVTLVSSGSATDYTFTCTAEGPSLLTNPRPAAWKQEDLPGLTERPIEALAASSDGRIVAVGGWGPVGVWRDGKLWRKFQVNDEQGRTDATRLSLSHDARLLAIGTFHARHAWIWDLEGRDDRPMLLHEEQFFSGAMVAFSPDGRWLSCSGDDEIRVLDTTSWKVVACWPREVRHAGYTSFTADSKLLLIQHTREDIALVRTGTWEELLILQSPVRDTLTGIDLSPSGRWLAASGGYEGAHWLWDLHALERELRSMGLGW